MFLVQEIQCLSSTYMEHEKIIQNTFESHIKTSQQHIILLLLNKKAPKPSFLTPKISASPALLSHSCTSLTREVTLIWYKCCTNRHLRCSTFC